MNAKKWVPLTILVVMVLASFALSIQFGLGILCAVVSEVCVKHLMLSNNNDQ